MAKTYSLIDTSGDADTSSVGTTNEDYAITDVPVDEPVSNPTLVSTQTMANGDIVGYYSDGSQKVIGTTGAGDYMAAQQAAQQESYISSLSNLFNSYGLDSLVPKIKELITAGYSADTVSLMLQDTAEYKQRFYGNEVRKKLGISILSPAEYLATENAYRQIMNAAGLPKGYYDSYTDFSNLIGSDISAMELKGRVDAAAQVINDTDPLVTQQLQQYYGLDKGTMIAHVLDPKAALPFIQKQVAAAQFGAEAARQNLGVGLGTAEQYANMGITQAQAQQGFSAIGQMLPAAQVLSQVYGTEYGQQQAMAEVFGQDAAAAARRKKLSTLEQAAFSGASGVGGSSLASPTAGAF